MLLAQVSPSIRKWTTSYVYKSLNTLLRLRGKPNKTVMMELVTGFTPNGFILNEFLQWASRWLQKIPEEYDGRRSSL